MQAVRLYAPHDLRLVEVDVPEPEAGEIVIAVEAAGICGTDRHLYHGTFPCTPPVTLGHEFSGRIVATGSGVSLPVGQRVTCDPNIACQTCDQCLRGRPNLCPNNIATGLSRDGGFAPFARFPAHRAIALPDDLPATHGAFCEPLACTLHGIDIAALRPGERCIVVGGGVIGLLAQQLARRAGAEVMMVTRSADKQALALATGATHVAAGPEAARRIWPEGADAVIECAGTPATVAMSPALVRNGGRIVVLGVLDRGQKIEIEPFDLLFREVQMHYSFLNPFTQSRAAALIASGQIDVAPLVSRTLTLAEAVAAIAAPAPASDVRAIVVPA